jgi:hypothetical protein
MSFENRILDVRGRGAVRSVLPVCSALSPQFVELCRSEGGRTHRHQRLHELHQPRRGLANRYALIFAPLAIVQAVGSTTPLFVVLIGVILTLMFPKVSRENLSRASSCRRASPPSGHQSVVVLVSR